MVKQITEKDGVHEDWYKEAKDMTVENLPEFIKKLMEDYSHDYGTICHAMSAAAVATIWAMNKSKQGGITGFQAGCIMWSFVREWNHSDNRTGLKMVDYDNFLYPQYEDSFDKTLGKDFWNAIQKEAAVKVKAADESYEKHLVSMEEYGKEIAVFVEKHQDYYDRKGHYDHIGMGNGVEWKAEEEKKKSGFEFAPQKPYCPINSSSPVYKHWISIVKGAVPFGYTVSA